MPTLSPSPTSTDKFQHVLVDGKKPCSGCREWKPVERFNRDKRNPTGFAYECIECRREQGKKSYRKHVARRREIGRQWKERNTEYLRDRYFRYYYGISASEFDAMLAAQGGVCAICKQTEKAVWVKRTGKTRNMCVDHDHETGRVRGILCGLCNTGIGALKHDPQLLLQAIEYLSRQAK